ncbi:MAG: hypothetical protein M0Z39_04255 [Actinomycetota bacterium]|nr:hypothetical protein [Actinomycetota bacterium]
MLKIDSDFIQLAVDERRGAIVLSVVTLGECVGKQSGCRRGGEPRAARL